MERVRLGRMENPVRGILHGSAALVSVAGLIALLLRSGDRRMAAAAAVYGVALVLMYSTSALYHSVPWRPRWKARLQNLDHTFIYALVAGTFTPLVVGVSRGIWVIIGLGAVWGLVAIGVASKVAPRFHRNVWLPLQFLAGAFLLAPLVNTLLAMDPIAAVLTAAGGAVYILGVILFVNHRPRLFPNIFSHHEFWHVVVIIASVIHFLAVWRVVA